MSNKIKVNTHFIRDKNERWDWNAVFAIYKKDRFYVSTVLAGKTQFLLGVIIARETIVLGLGFIDLRIQWMYASKR